MEVSLGSKPHVSYAFEVQKVIGISCDGKYQVQWAPAWVSKFHLVGCEHLIQEFLQEQAEKEIQIDTEIHLAVPDITGGMDGSKELEAQEAQELFKAPSEVEEVTEPVQEVKMEPVPYELPTQISHNLDPVQESNRQSELKLRNKPRSQLGLPEDFEDRHSAVQMAIPGANSQNSLETSNSIMKMAGKGDNSIIDENWVKSKDSGAAGGGPLTLNAEITLQQTEPLFSVIQQINTLYPTDMPPVPKYFCNICSKELSCKSGLTRHMIQHSERKYKCPRCPKSFKRKDYLKTHIRFHSGVRPYSCNQCNYSFVQKGDLAKHIRTHDK